MWRITAKHGGGNHDIAAVSFRGSFGICAALFGAKVKLTTSGDSPEVGFLAFILP